MTNEQLRQHFTKNCEFKKEKVTNFTSEKKRPEDFDKYREIHQKAFQQYSDIQTKQTKFESVRNKHLTYV